jgi:sugar phosphate permease
MLHTLLASPDQQTLAAGFILSGIKGIFYLIGGIIAAIICGLIAKSKGYSAILFAILGFFFSIITLIVILVIPRKR